MNRGSVRTLPVLLLAVGIVASLSSCATAPFSDGCESAVTSGPASSLISVNGPLSSSPHIDFPTPVITQKTERTDIITGTGQRVSDGDLVVMKYTMLNGATGEVKAQQRTGVIVTLGDSPTPAVTKGLECTTVGSRVAIVSTAAGAGQNTAEVKDSIVFVIDVIDAFPGKAYGAPQIPQAGMPSVVTAPNGAPGVTVPKQAPPTELTTNVLIASDGEKLAADDHALVKYTGFLWSSGSVFDSTWTNGQATILTLTPSAKVTQGLVDGLVGQRIGSQVLVVIPPDEGFGAAGAPGVSAGQTLIYVVDILGTVE